MSFEKLKEVGIVVLLGLLLTVGIFKIFGSNSDLQKGLTLKQEVGILIAKGMGEFGKYDKNLTTYAEESNIFNKTFGRYHLGLIQTNKSNGYVIPILAGGIGELDGETLYVQDTTNKNFMDIQGSSHGKPAFGNLKLFNESKNNKKIFPFFVTRGTYYGSNDCKNKLTHAANTIQSGKTTIIGVESLGVGNTKKTLVGNWGCKFRTLSTNDYANSNCEKPGVRLCNVNSLSTDIFGYVTSGYLGIGFFETVKEAEDFDSQYFGGHGSILTIDGEGGTKMYSVLLQI